jgi:FtsZ-binding cell division protein ZapB
VNPLSPESVEPTSVMGWISYAAVGIATAGFALQKALKGWAADRVARLSDDAVSDTIQLLREENERLRTHNAELVTVFQDAQTRIVQIAGENQRMSGEINQLRDDLARALRKLEGV